MLATSAVAVRFEDSTHPTRLDEANASLDLLNDLVGTLADKLNARVLMA